MASTGNEHAGGNGGSTEHTSEFMSNIDTIDGDTAGLLLAETCLLEQACHHTNMPAVTRCLTTCAHLTHTQAQRRASYSTFELLAVKS